MKKLRIAYLVLSNSNPALLNRLYSALNQPETHFFIHIDKKTDINRYSLPHKKNIHLEVDREKVYWGEFSQVRAIVKLLQSAHYFSNFDYYILLYGSDYPVRSNTVINNYLLSRFGKQFINITKMPGIGKTMDRIWYYRFQEAYGRNDVVGLIKRTLNYLIRLFKLKRKFPDQYRGIIFYGGCSKWAITRSCADYILTFIKTNPGFVKYWENTLIPDETFFHTIIGNSIYINNYEGNLLYEDWSRHGASPEFLHDEHLPIIGKDVYKSSFGKSKILFARKLSDASKSLLDYIDQKLRLKI